MKPIKGKDLVRRIDADIIKEKPEASYSERMILRGVRLHAFLADKLIIDVKEFGEDF